VSTQSSRSSADLSTPDFGPNEWLVDELYQKYLEDPNSVDRAWWNFFADYQPDRPAKADGATAAPPAPQTAPAAPVPKQKPAQAPTEKAAEKAPEKPAKKAAPAPQVPSGAEEVRLRGVAARTVTNMEASLAVPTATSVRAVPAKLLIDNRIVINNHLKRGRGGKVSFTHLIGYALVRALQAMP